MKRLYSTKEEFISTLEQTKTLDQAKYLIQNAWLVDSHALSTLKEAQRYFVKLSENNDLEMAVECLLIASALSEKEREAQVFPKGAELLLYLTEGIKPLLEGIKQRGGFTPEEERKAESILGLIELDKEEIANLQELYSNAIDGQYWSKELE